MAGDVTPPPSDNPLAAPPSAAAPPRKPTPVLSADELADIEAQATAEALQQLYRPAHNPTRFNLQARGIVAFVGSGTGEISGRTGGVSVDLGQSWNRIGYALTLTGLGGNIGFGTSGTSMLGLLGGGPTLTLGRLALVRRGFADLRVGYDVYYGFMHRGPGLQGIDDVRAPDRAIPHGFRVRLDLGLLVSPHHGQRVFQGGGINIGYQGLVGNIGGGLPYLHVLSLGLTYSLG